MLTVQDLDEAAEYAKDLADCMYQHYGIGNHHPTVMRRRNSSYLAGGYDGIPYQIVLGWKGFQHVMLNGYIDYKSIQGIWEGRPKGLEAIHRIVLHEFAHVLQRERNGIKRGSIHNQCFVWVLRDLIKEWPYESYEDPPPPVWL